MRRALAMVLWAFCAGCPTGESGDRCKEHSDCNSDLVCVNQKCGTPWARRWRLTINGASISALDSSGNAWDADGSDPDPFVIVNLDDNEILRTQTRDNTRQPTWSESVVINLNSNSRVQIALWDSDFLFPQPLVATPNALVTLYELKQGHVVASAQTGPADAGVGGVTSVAFDWLLEE